MKKVILTIIGGILGIPLSYYFQPEMVQEKIGGLGGYIRNFGDIINQKDLIGNVFLGVFIFALVGFIIGYFLDSKLIEKTN